MVDRLDSEQIELLRAWGAGLATDERDEVRAAGKAITMLVDEIDRLNIDLWNQRAGEEPAPEAPVRAGARVGAARPAAPAHLALRAGRLARGVGALRRPLRPAVPGTVTYNSRRSARRAASYSARARCTAGSSEISATGTSHQLS